MTRAASVNDRLFTALTALIVLAPLPLASNRPWAWSLLALAVALLTLAWVAARLKGRCRPGLPLRRLAVPAGLFAIAVAWGWVQMIPSPFPSLAHPAWAEAGRALGLDLPGRISAAPERTAHALIRLLAYALIFLLATQLGRPPHRAGAALRAVAWAALAYSAYALASHLLGLEYILWIPKWSYVGDATGVFVGRAAFGAYAGIGVLACLALAIRQSAAQRPVIGAGERLELLLARTVPWLVAAGVLWMAVFASHSRGAFLVTGLASVALVLAATAGRLLRLRHAVILLLLVTLLAGAVLLIEGAQTISRFTGGGDLTGDRPNLMRLAWSAIADAPLVGHGLGAFEFAINPYRDVSLPRPVIYDFAHNSWEEVIMDLGWPAGLCLLAAVVYPVLACCAGIRRRRQDQIHPVMAVATAILLGLQATVDFTVQIPALAALLAFVLGIGYAQSWSTAPTLGRSE